MSKKKVFLHIGSHKTGTSAIYQFLKKNQSAIKNNSDFLFYEPSPWPLKMERNKLNFKLRLEGFKKVNHLKEKNIIISHENYSWLHKEEDWREIFDCFDKDICDVYIVWYIRRQDSLAVSQKQEGTKWVDNSLAYGHTLEPIPKYEELTEEAKIYLDYLYKYKTLTSIFGKNKVLIKVFEKGKLIDNDIVKDFCSLINLPTNPTYFYPGRVNESIPRLTQMFLHKTRKFYDEYSIEKKYLTRTAISLDKESKEKYLPSKTEAKNFYQHFTKNNNKLFKEINGKDGSLFDDSWDQYPDEVLKKDIDFDEINTIYSSVIKKLAEEIDSWRTKDKTSALENDEKTIKSLFQLSNYFEKKNDHHSALKVMEKALEIRPNGPFIKRKIDKLNNIINKNPREKDNT